MLPGYVLVRMIMNDDTWYVVRNTRGVTGFVGPGSKPVPLTEQEVRNMGVNRENEEFEFVEGETVTVLNGAWINTQGVIKAINAAKQTLTITVEMFGRETPVEIAFEDVKVEHY
jgi:transcriptional antiterminator NusG